MAETGKKPGSAAEKAVDTLQARLADYASRLTWDDLPPQVVQAAKLRLIDTLGAAIGGFDGGPCRITRDLAAAMPNPAGATLWGTAQRTSPDLAAFANATAARYLEYTDFYHWPGALDGHASDVMEAVLAAAETSGASGRDLLLATVLGYEVFLRFCDIFPRGGFDYTNCSTLGSAVAAGRLMGLSAQALGHCIAMAVVPNVILKQVRRDGKTAFKPVATGHAARAGVFAAMLARAGLDGPNLPFEGNFGFCANVLGQRPEIGPVGGAGGSFKILDSQIKIRPSERNTVPLILAAEKLVPAPGNIQRVVVEIYAKAIEIVGQGEAVWNPQTHSDAYHSLPYVVAATLTDGTIHLNSFDATHRDNPRLRALMGRVELVENPDFTRAFHAEPVEHRTRITLHLAGGETRVAEVGRDDDLRAQSDVGQISAKFRSLTEKALGPARVDRLLDRLLHIEEAESIAGLLGDLVILPAKG